MKKYLKIFRQMYEHNYEEEMDRNGNNLLSKEETLYHSQKLLPHEETLSHQNKFAVRERKLWSQQPQEETFIV